MQIRKVPDRTTTPGSHDQPHSRPKPGNIRLVCNCAWYTWTKLNTQFSTQYSNIIHPLAGYWSYLEVVCDCAFSTTPFISNFYPVYLISIQLPALVLYYYEAGVSHFLQGIPVLRYFFYYKVQCTCINSLIQVYCSNFPCSYSWGGCGRVSNCVPRSIVVHLQGFPTFFFN